MRSSSLNSSTKRSRFSRAYWRAASLDEAMGRRLLSRFAQGEAGCKRHAVRREGTRMDRSEREAGGASRKDDAAGMARNIALALTFSHVACAFGRQLIENGSGSRPNTPASRRGNRQPPVETPLANTVGSFYQGRLASQHEAGEL